MKKYEVTNSEIKTYFTEINKVLEPIRKGKYEKAIKKIRQINKKYAGLENTINKEENKEDIEYFNKIYSKISDAVKKKKKLFDPSVSDASIILTSTLTAVSVLVSLYLNMPDVAGMAGGGFGSLVGFSALMKICEPKFNRKKYKAGEIEYIIKFSQL